MVALPALYHGRAALVLIKHTCPFADALQNRNNRCTLLRKRVFDPRRYLVIRSARNKASCDKPFQRGGKHRVGDVAHLAAQLTVPQRTQRRQHADDARVPLPAEQLHAVFQWTADVLSSLYSEPSGSYVVLIIGRIQGKRKI